MAIDGNYDGKITIQEGQGLSQAICDELNLTQEDRDKLGGSIWTQIFQQVEAQNQQGQIYSGGNDLKGPANKNFVVDTNQIIEFSKEIWNNIVQLVNGELDKDIARLEDGTTPPTDGQTPPTDGQTPPTDGQTPPTDGVTPSPADPNPPTAADPNPIPPLAADQNPPAEVDQTRPLYLYVNLPSEIIKQYPSYANTMVNNGRYTVRYDKDGYATETYDNMGRVTGDIYRDDDGSIYTYHAYEYDLEGNKTRLIVHNADGGIDHYRDCEYDEKGKETRIIYRRADGSLDYYYDCEYDKEGKLTRTIYRSADGNLMNYYDYGHDEKNN